MRRKRSPAALVVPLCFAVSCATAPTAPPPRDRFPLDPREGLTGPFDPAIEAGWKSLLAGDAAAARREFAAAPQEPGSAARIGEIEALVAGKSLPEALALCREDLAARRPTLPLLVACGEANAGSGEAMTAFDLYREAVLRAPDRSGLSARAEELRRQASDGLRREAHEAAGNGDWKAARHAAAKAIEIDPGSAPAHETAGDVAREAGDAREALAEYQKALDLAPGSRALQEKTARLALELSDYAAAIGPLDRLAAEDPEYAAQAAQARLDFRVANWPAGEREAAKSPRLTRGEAARLVWWMMPEVRDTAVTSGVIASDVVGRPDSREVSRAVSLGLLDADPDTHRARPDAPLTLPAASRLYFQLLVMLAPAVAPECLAGQPAAGLSRGEAVRAARDCGIVGASEGSPLTGPAFTASLDRVRALAAGEARQAGAPEGGP
jgi:tetratricopeptide (TPR) repeat protein